ncbi:MULTISPECIES: A24 family peptidase C-terminal domain-containing protein [unclassified Archaeoglobus]|jgi:preflagellin peptidase FlaK|uniref:A24 family peptidase C-terminal domain-containing protein n=1 Tax=unclassified Archaeoglobus TaxID=2643606 RepID=UPI0025BF55B9|nr:MULTISPECIES: A24 family peptidase C-terminal domain-containing protein [unclassified Archaeoglobus]
MSAIDLLKFILVFGFLLYACKLDIESRIVPNRVWKYMLILTLPITIFQIVTELQPQLFYMLAGIQILMVVSLAYFLYYIGAYGGADAKALMCLSVIFPFYPTFNGFPMLNFGFGSFAFSTLANSVIAAPALLIGMFIRNLAVEGVRGLKGNFLYYLTGYKAKVDNLPKFHNLLEYVDENGKLRRVRRAVEPDEELIERLRGKKIETVWVTPALPFLVFITAGYIAAFFLGDLLYLLISNISSW